MKNQQLNSRTMEVAKHSDSGGTNTAGKMGADFRAGQSTRILGYRDGPQGYTLRAISLAFTVGFLLIPFSARAQQQYVFENIAAPGDTFTQLLGINDADVIAGYHGQAVNQGFTLTLPDVFTPQSFPGSDQTQVTGINNLGNTSGFYIDSGGNNHGFLRTSGVFSTVDFSGTTFDQVLGLNNTGQAAGYFQAPGGTQTAFIFNPFLPPGGQFTLLNLPGSAQATGINDQGQVTGFFATPAGDDGFLLSGGIRTTLSFPGAAITEALGLNNLGQVVGFYQQNANSDPHGFLFSGGTFTSIDEPGANGTTINGINNLGSVIVGFAKETNGNTVGFVGAPLVVPEPSIFSLLALGSTALVGMCILRSRRYLR
jgi:probable HAF family extracellular repeat protein